MFEQKSRISVRVLSAQLDQYEHSNIELKTKKQNLQPRKSDTPRCQVLQK